MHDLTYAGLQL